MRVGTALGSSKHHQTEGRVRIKVVFRATLQPGQSAGPTVAPRPPNQRTAKTPERVRASIAARRTSTTGQRGRPTREPQDIPHPKPHRPAQRGSSGEPFGKSRSRTSKMPTPWKNPIGEKIGKGGTGDWSRGWEEIPKSSTSPSSHRQTPRQGKEGTCTTYTPPPPNPKTAKAP